MNFMRDLTEIGAIVTVILVVGVIAIGVPAYWLDVYSCDKYHTATGKPTKYVGLECYVQDGGNWFSWAEYKYRLAATAQGGQQ